MPRRPLPLVALGLGLLGLVAGALGLQRVFMNERRDALEALAGQRSALESYAVRDLEERCRNALEAQRARIDAALRDPLADASGLLHVEAGRQRLPRRFAFAPDAPPSARTLYHQLVSGDLPVGSPGDGPWSERLRYLADFRAALAADDRNGIELAVRAILTHRARFVIRSRDDLVSMVALLDLLEKSSGAAPVLLERVLREGLTDSRGSRTPGLQVQLLDRREKLSRGDFEFLAERIARLSESAGVRHDDFNARVAEPSAPTIALPESLSSPVLLEGGAWFVEPSDGELVQGVAVDVTALLARTRAEMLERGLLEAGDELAAGELSSAPEPFDALTIAVRSPRWERSRAAIDRRFWIKTGLTVTLVALVSGAVVLWWAWTRRERQLLALKSDFVATVSHELRTPLASMRLMAETLERRLQGMDFARDYPRRLVREIDSLNFLVENILSFNRLEKGRWEPRVEDVRLSEIVRALEEELPGATRARVRVQLEGAKDVVLRADPELIRLLFLNLGTNACKYNAGDPVWIRIEAEGVEPTVIRVADNGIGIPGDQVESVFSEFYRAERGGRGFGLGLAICRRIMELHAGHIRVADSSGSGTVFELSFP